MMCQWTEKDLLLATNGTLTKPLNTVGTGVSIDTRTLKKGDIFIALVGERNNGHLYVKKAFELGACCAIVSQSIDEKKSNIYPLLRVPNTYDALTKMGFYARTRFKGKMIAITGSVGKTTTKEMMKVVLSHFHKTHAALGSYNNHLGVPLTLANLDKNAYYCVCEIGMNHPNEIAPLAHMVKPNIAMVTEISSSHLEFMQSLDDIALEKSEIVSGLLKNGTLILPENLYGLQYFINKTLNKPIEILKVGISVSADILLKEIQLTKTGSNFASVINGQHIPFYLSDPGYHLVKNAGLVIGAASSLGLDMKKVAQALSTFNAGAGRGKQILLHYKNVVILDESYNASALSIQACLKTLKLIASKRKIAVLGDIKELGQFSQNEHLSLIPYLLKYTDRVFACGPMMKIVFDHLPQHLQGAWGPSANNLIPFIQDDLLEYDTLLIKGSHSMNMNTIIHALTVLAKRNKDAL